MADTGIFASTSHVEKKVGANASATSKAEAYCNQYLGEVESQINSVCRYNFSDNYATLNDDTKKILQEVATNLAAIYVISYDMSGFTSRIEAEDMINILRDAALRDIQILRDKKVSDFVREVTLMVLELGKDMLFTQASRYEEQYGESTGTPLGYVGQFTSTPATGTMASPDRVNNGVAGPGSGADTIGKYAEVLFPYRVRLKRWRFAHPDNANKDGSWKIQYFDYITYTWIDWVTGIPTGDTGTWTAYASQKVIETDSIRLVCTAVDTYSGNSYCNELEVIF